MIPVDHRPGARVWAGPILMCLAGLCFAVLDSQVKYLAAAYPLTQIVWARYAAQTVVLILIFAPLMGWRVLRVHSIRLQLLRGVCLLGASLLVINGLSRLPLTENTAILFIAPLVVTLLSGLLLKERARRIEWIAVLLGFTGVLIIARPGGSLLSWAIFFPIGTAVCNALYQIVTRSARNSEHPVTSNVYTGLIGLAALSPAMPVVWEPMAWLDVLVVSVAGSFAALGHMLMTRALEYSSAAALGPYSYTQLIWASLFGWLAFSAVPDAVSWLGILIIAAGGLLLSLHRLFRIAASK